MKKAIFLRFVVLCFVFLASQAKAQMYFIPDLNFRTYLQTNYASCMNATGDTIDGSCSAVFYTTYLNLHFLNISSLSGIQAFQNLEALDCSDNSLASLPALPPGLKFLLCSNNQLSILPILPSTLEILHCDYNQLTSLPFLPFGLAELRCRQNQLTSLTNLPPNLALFDCAYNKLTSLPPLPSSFSILECHHNLLTSLPDLPSSLTKIFCGDNLLTSLPLLPFGLVELSCGYNQLTSLPSLPATLTDLDCNFNFNLKCLPDLKNVNTLSFGGTAVQCLPNYGKIPSSTFPLCDLFNTNGCEVSWNISGTVYFDKDSNCIKTGSENGISNQKIKLYKNGLPIQQTYSNNEGNFYFDTDSLSIYKTSLDTSSIPFALRCPVSATYLDTLTITDSLKSNRNFAAKCKGIDLAVTSIYGAGFRPASQRPLTIYAGDFSNNFGGRCAKGVSGSVQIILSGPCQFVSAAPGALLPTNVSNDTLTYIVTDFGVINYNNAFKINVLIDTNAILGSQICVDVEISTTANEIDTTNNNLTQCFNIVNSFDPNDKSVFPTFLKPGVDNWLTYNINFQNTGNADAIDIFITDTLDANLDWSSFELLSYSHFPLIQLYNNGIIKFNYPKIYLPDSTNNEPESHGYVQFKIKALDSLAIGSVVNNTANIYFDFNAPVITNTVSNTVVNCQIPISMFSSTICEGDSYQLNGMVYRKSGVFFQHYINQFGCDSTIMLDLTVMSNSVTNINSTFCEGTTFDFNGLQLTSPGIYRDTLISVLGCDSTIILDLTVLLKSVANIDSTICEGTVFDFNGQQLTSPGIYSDTIINVLGCDSIVTLNLSVVPAHIYINDNFCQGSWYVFNNQPLSTPGIYTDTLTNKLGCDSIVILNLSVVPKQVNISYSICQGSSYNFNNQQLTTPGIYRDTLINSLGCDSIIVLNLSLVPTITNAITQNNAQLSTSGVGSSYNWIDCTTGLIVPNEIANVFNPPAAGSYSAVVYYGNCIDTSACFQFVTTGIAELNDALININPNPFQEELTITRKDNRKETLEVYNLLGEQILQTEIQDKRTTLSTQTWPAGIYIVKVVGDRDVVTTRVLKY